MLFVSFPDLKTVVTQKRLVATASNQRTCLENEGLHVFKNTVAYNVAFFVVFRELASFCLVGFSDSVSTGLVTAARDQFQAVSSVFVLGAIQTFISIHL